MQVLQKNLQQKLIFLNQNLKAQNIHIITQKKGWIKIQTHFDNYIRYIKRQEFKKQFKPQRKIYKPKSIIFIKKKK